MRNTAPIGLGICAVAALFGLVGGAMLFVMWDYTWLGAAFMAGLIALIVAIVLWLGWRPANTAARDMHAEAHRAGQAPTAGASSAAAPAASAPKAAAPAPEPAPAAKEPDPAPAPAPAAEKPATPEPAAAAAKPAIKSTLLPGETELSQRKGDWKYEAKAEADASPAKASAPAAAEGPGTKPATLSAAREGGPDNLKEIKGVGPKLEQMLHGMGFYHFDQVAAWTEDEIAWVDQNLEGFKGRVSRDNWVEQAKILAAGGETEFSKKVDKGGVY